MAELLQRLAPNVMGKLPELWECCGQTLIMLLVSGLISFLFGMALGVLLTVTRRGGILPNAVLFTAADKAVNIFRSVPFIILLFALIPLTRAVTGTAIGTRGAILPLVFGTVPFFSRQIESALSELPDGLVRAAQSMGVGPLGIITRVYLRECIPGIVRAATITFVSLVGLTAMAGAVGGGGLGDFAIRYGYQRNQMDVTYASVLILLLLVSVIQWIGNFVIRKTTH